MKKKLLLVVMMVSILACLFAISISAETITYEGKSVELVNDLGSPSWYTGDTANAIKDKESIVILKDENGEMTAYPSYYVFRYWIEKSGSKFTVVRINWSDQKGVDYSFINEKTGKNYVNGSMYYVELPSGIFTCTAAGIWGKGKTEPNVVEFVIPDTVTTISSNAFAQLDNCKKITMSKNIVVIDEWSFYNSKDLETVIFPKDCTLQKIVKGSFSGCAKLSSINLEDCHNLISIGDAGLSGCKGIDVLALPDSLQTIGFQAIYGLGEVELASDYLPKSLKTVDQYFLSDCQLKNEVLYFPEGFTSLSARYCFIGSFAPKTSLTLVFLGKMKSVNLVDTPLTIFMNNGSKQPIRLVFAQNTFSDLSGGVLETVDFNGEKGFVAISGENKPLYTMNEGTLTVTFENANYYNTTNLGNDEKGNIIYKASGSPTEMIFCGGDNVEISYTVRCNHTDLKWYRFSTVGEVYDMTAHNVHYNNRVYQEGNCGYDEVTTNTCIICDLQSIVYGEKATGEHTYTDDFNCETALDCEVCAKTLFEALTHDIKTTILYENGYASEGLKSTACQNQSCQHSVGEVVVKALFTCLGYSSSETGVGGIAIGYMVNGEAITDYTSASGVTLKYGVFAVMKNKLGDNDVFGENGTVANGVINAEITNYGFTAFELKVTGFTDEYKDAKLAMGAYVLVNDGKATEYSYLQDEEKGTLDGKYYFVSYNDIVVSAN